LAGYRVCCFGRGSSGAVIIRSPQPLPPGTFRGKVFKALWLEVDLWKSYPVLKGLATKYSLHWVYRVHCWSGDALQLVQVGPFAPRLWPFFLGDGFGDWLLVKL